MKNVKGERETDENYTKAGKKALKCILLGWGWGKNDRNAQNIPLCLPLSGSLPLII